MGRKLVNNKGSRLCLLPFLLLLVITGTILVRHSPQTINLIEDTDGNGINETYTLKDKQVTVNEANCPLWQSPESWDIQQILLADADNEGQAELLMVVWKEGSFGSSRPMWLEGETDDEYTCHLFVYRLIAGKMKPVWCSSALDRPIKALKATDTDNDGSLELQVRESLTTITTWQWQGWGFFQK